MSYLTISSPSERFCESSLRARHLALRYCRWCALRALEIVISLMGITQIGKCPFCDRNGWGATASGSIAMGPGNRAQAKFPVLSIIKREAAQARALPVMTGLLPHMWRFPPHMRQKSRHHFFDKRSDWMRSGRCRFFLRCHAPFLYKENNYRDTISIQQ